MLFLSCFAQYEENIRNLAKDGSDIQMVTNTEQKPYILSHLKAILDIPTNRIGAVRINEVPHLQ